jgi:hypothetical protein
VRTPPGWADALVAIGLAIVTFGFFGFFGFIAWLVLK